MSTARYAQGELTELRYAPMVIVNWSPVALGLVRTLAQAAPVSPEAGPPVICVGTESAASIEEALHGLSARALLRYVQVPSLAEGIEPLASALEQTVRIAAARAVIVLPDSHAEEPDAASRLTCAAVSRACGPYPVPNILVEVEDPEAAYEFAGLGVATVFYPGYLRAALLAHACVDLGVFQFVYGLLRGRYRVRLRPVPHALKEGTFFDVARALEVDEAGNPITAIGLQLPSPEQPGPDGETTLKINPGPGHPVRDAVGVLVLVDS
ncbi:MAG: hypothetical protein K0V04_37400 [Deltaproteobacteria bacterium]|nr:hypothetical protein [Deltaproteobacteria bacterium]